MAKYIIIDCFCWLYYRILIFFFFFFFSPSLKLIIPKLKRAIEDAIVAKASLTGEEKSRVLKGLKW